MAKRKRTYNTNLIKRTISYSIIEIAELFGIHRATVRNWFKKGLRKIDDRRPILVNGADLELFLKELKAERKHKCQPNEMYCCRCRLPRQANDNRVVLKVLNEKVGRLSGLCAECGSKIYRAISLKKLNVLRETFIIVSTQGTDIEVFDSPNVNTHLKEDIST